MHFRDESVIVVVFKIVSSKLTVRVFLGIHYVVSEVDIWLHIKSLYCRIIPSSLKNEITGYNILTVAAK